MRAASARNLAKATVMIAVLAALAAGLGWLFAERSGATFFAICSLMASFAVLAVGDRVVLGLTKARRLARAEEPVLQAAVARVAARLQIPAPQIAVAHDGFPMSYAVGRGPRSATVAVSSALLAALPIDELEALLAHELAHVKRRDVLTQTLAAVYGHSLLEITRIGGWFTRALVALLAPVAAAFTHALLSPRRELSADEVAVGVTDPEALAGALLRIDAASDLVRFTTSPAFAPLYPVDPLDPGERMTRLFASHPPLEERLARLRNAPVPREPTSAQSPK